MSNTSPTVDTISPDFTQQHKDQQLPHDLLGGTRAMIRAEAQYIAQERGEDSADYNIRLNRTVLFNVYKRTLRYLGGRVFEKQVSLGEDAGERFQAFTEDVDKQGHNLTVWSREVFEHGLNDGVTFCLVDFSKVPTRRANGRIEYQRQDGTWATKTEAADRENEWSPYFIHVPAESVLDGRMDYKDGKAYVSHFRYIATLEKPDGPWGTQRYQQIRAFFYDESGSLVWQTWENKSDGDKNFTRTEDGTLSIGVIPVAMFMPGDKRTGMTAEPALMDLAELNKRHWQATSSQFNLMEYVRRPPWFGNKLGIVKEGGEREVIFGPNCLCLAEQDGAFLQSVGIDPGSVAAGRQELADLEDRMAMYGLQLLQPKTGAITATESLRDAEENNSTLKAWALQFQDFLENCMKYVALWWGESDGPSVKVNTDFANALDASFLLEMRRANEISRETFLGLVKGLGILPDDFDVTGEAEKMAQELMVNGGANGVTGLAQRLGVGGI